MRPLAAAWSIARANLLRRENALRRLREVGLDGIRAKPAKRIVRRAKGSQESGLSGGEVGSLASATVQEENAPKA